ncbi:hypothetical protein AB1Y20_006849 [Prymnesium parvum]|uniref:Glycosyltransferase family 92 protein n=1 Tax=Prymnesium parvum TaxID=97485 RepID=A0AB34J1V3_PRYPA
MPLACSPLPPALRSLPCPAVRLSTSPQLMMAARSRSTSAWRRAKPHLAPPLLSYDGGAPQSAPLASWTPRLSAPHDLPPRMRGKHVKLCIALLVKGAPLDVVRDYCRYHLYVGFSQLFLFFDDPAADREAYVAVDGIPGVACFLCDRKFWRQCVEESEMVRRREQNRVFEDTAACVETEHKCRQNLCVELAIRRARAMGLDWLLHIDIDEVFLPQAEHPQDFFANLPAEVVQVQLANHEVVPECLSVTNWMRDASLFKVNRCFADAEGLRRLWQSVRLAREQALPGAGAATYFNAYEGFKSAVRLESTPLPYDVHKFLVLAPFDRYVAPSAKMTRAPTSAASDPVILHWANCGLHNWRRKYLNLGNFPNLWWGRVPIKLPVHLISRDLVHGAGAEEAEHFYRKVIMADTPAERACLSQAGLLVRVDFPRNCLLACDSEEFDRQKFTE